ncbi:MAG TPA: DUF3617 family protein [Phenylobacterium sp.]|nr:DUF3617 family protein [Phenylobacterium sp.]
MNWRHGILALSAAALALGGCSKPAGEKAAQAPDAGQAASATTPAKAPAAGPPAMPTRKPGLWKQTVSTSGMEQVSSICLDKEVESKLAVWGAGASKDICQQSAVTPAPGGWAFTSSCDMGSGGKVSSKGRVTGDFNTSYRVESESVTEGAGAPQMNGPHKMTLTATWQGPCPADMKPGDMALANGMKINMMDMTAGHPAMPRPSGK